MLGATAALRLALAESGPVSKAAVFPSPTLHTDHVGGSLLCKFCRPTRSLWCLLPCPATGIWKAEGGTGGYLLARPVQTQIPSSCCTRLAGAGNPDTQTPGRCSLVMYQKHGACRSVPPAGPTDVHRGRRSSSHLVLICQHLNWPCTAVQLQTSLARLLFIQSTSMWVVLGLIQVTCRGSGGSWSMLPSYQCEWSGDEPTGPLQGGSLWFPPASLRVCQG